MKDFILKHKLVIISIAVLSIFLIGGTYALLTIELFGEKSNTIIVGTLELELDESTCTGINISNGVPVTDEDGMKEVACTFTLENTGEVTSDYTFYLDDVNLESGEVRMQDKFIKYSLVKNSVNSINLLTTTGSNPNRVIDNGVLNVGDSNSYELRLWIDSGATAEVMGTIALMKLRVVSGIYQPKGCLDLPSYGGEPNPPELVGDMIPVVYDESSSNWVKADTSNTSYSWYDYDEQEWANVVTVTSTNRATHVAATPGTAIPMSDINTFMVWIPRYSYTIKDTYGVQGCGGSTPSVTTPGAFDIKFISSNTTDLGSAEYTGGTAENWFTNSAFCWGNSCDDELTRSNPENRELSGIWVAKFETSNSGSSTPNSLPNVTSWRSINISTMFNTIQSNMNGATGTNTYGLSGSTYDAHMMKNTEWGAVAYLTQSRYGKYGNEDYTGANKEVAINNCSSYITGIAGDSVSASESSSSCSTNTYNTETGQSASTTGNITGIYDMSGGAYEYVMGNMQDSSGNFYPWLSGFATAPEAKYYNSYVNGSSNSDYTRYIKGDATKEMAGFYSDYKYFVYGSTPWFYIGGYYRNSSAAGLASFSYHNGGSSSSNSFRFSLVP